MKNLLIATFLICFCNTSYSQGWSLVWEDDFSGTTLDQTKWTHDLGTGSQYGLWGWGNGELQFYSENNIAITEISSESGNNALHITAYQESSEGIVDQWGNPLNYTSGKVTSKSKVTVKYGMISKKIRVTVNALPAIPTGPGEVADDAAKQATK